MKGWRCYNCNNDKGDPGLDFYGDKPICPKCGLDGTNQRYRGLFAALKVIHFDAPDPALAKGSGRHTRGIGHAACDPKLKVGTVQATGEPTVVNCPACRESQAWIDADKTVNFNPEDDFPVSIDLAGTMIVKG